MRLYKALSKKTYAQIIPLVVRGYIPNSDQEGLQVYLYAFKNPWKKCRIVFCESYPASLLFTHKPEEKEGQFSVKISRREAYKLLCSPIIYYKWRPDYKKES